MKKITILFFTLAFSMSALAQTDTSKPYYKSRTLPSFKLLDTDSVVFTNKVLDIDKSTIVMMFNPDCDHCQHQLDTLLSIPELTKNAQVIMISMVPLHYNKDFYNKNHLEKYPFVHMGKDFNSFCLGFYQPYTIPVLVFYNKKREFVAIKYGNADKATIMEGIRN